MSGMAQFFEAGLNYQQGGQPLRHLCFRDVEEATPRRLPEGEGLPDVRMDADELAELIGITVAEAQALLRDER